MWHLSFTRFCVASWLVLAVAHADPTSLGHDSKDSSSYGSENQRCLALGSGFKNNLNLIKAVCAFVLKTTDENSNSGRKKHLTGTFYYNDVEFWISAFVVNGELAGELKVLNLHAEVYRYIHFKNGKAQGPYLVEYAKNKRIIGRFEDGVQSGNWCILSGDGVATNCIDYGSVVNECSEHLVN